MLPCRIWSFCVKGCTHKYRRTLTIVERWNSAVLGWEAWLTPTYTPLPTCVTTSNLVVLRQRQGRSQPRISEGALASGSWARWWVRTNVAPFAAMVRGRDPRNFLYILNTKSCILVHSLAPEMSTTSVFLSRPYALGEMKTVGRGCLMRPEGQKNRGRRPTAGWGSWRGGSKPHQLGSNTTDMAFLHWVFSCCNDTCYWVFTRSDRRTDRSHFLK